VSGNVITQFLIFSVVTVPQPLFVKTKSQSEQFRAKMKNGLKPKRSHFAWSAHVSIWNQLATPDIFASVAA